jgi:hypothetical protein
VIARVLRWFIDGTRIAQPATDNATSAKNVYRYLHEGIHVLAAHAPDLRESTDGGHEGGAVAREPGWGRHPHRPGGHARPQRR